MITAKFDHRQYRMTENLGGLRVLLVHDSKATSSAISLTISAGHFQEPSDCPGLAHLLEHCLFSGCKAYPEENQINHYIESNGGQINAWTTAEMSGFNIDCQTRDFALCNHMLASMLTTPLFPEASIEKEITAIDAEFQSKRHEDQRRIQQVDKETCNPAHPYHHFSTGNRDCYQSVSISTLREKLKTFHQQYYHAKNMCLCLISNLDLDQVQEHIIPFYDDLAPNGATLEAPTEPLYLPEQLGTFLHIKPIKNMRALMVSFSLPDIHHWYESKPEALISAMLGDETRGSLLCWLQHNQWVTHLSAGGGIQGSNFKDYTINLQLTENGLNHIDDILESIFDYLRLIKEEDFPNWRFEEMKQLNQLAFDYQEFPKIGKLATYLATQMHYYPKTMIAYGEYIVTAFDKSSAQTMLSYFRPDNMRVKLIHPQAKTDTQSLWYHVDYAIDTLPKELLQKLSDPPANDELALPDANPYMTSDLTVYPVQAKFHLPQALSIKDNGEFWFGQDPEFSQPKNELFLSLGCGALNDSVEASAHTRIWTSAAQAFINDNFYAASVAGIYSHVYPHKRGVTLHVAGFSQFHADVSQKVLTLLLDPNIVVPYFEQAKKQRLTALSNSLLNKPINRLFATLNNLIHEHSFLPEELAQVIEKTQLEEIQAVPKTLTKSYWQALAYGNWTESVAQEMDTYLRRTFNAANAENYENRVLRLSALQQNIVAIDCQQPESALVYYLQGKANTLRDKAICIAIEHLLAPDYFQLMRYEKQYGYQLGCGYLPFMKAPGIALYIQSPVTSALELHKDTEAFLHQIPDNIRQMSSDAWERTKQALQKQLGANDQNLSIKCQRLWAALDNENQNFSEFEQIKTALMGISPLDIADYLSDLMNTKEGKLSLITLNDKKMPLTSEDINYIDVTQFRALAKQYI
ncbi:insulinase family protein [Alteromonas sp. a30]|uniref:insulinase family protein n=1 Tax=Alteromonas sp. a30 TaxID=2730917 RepID=UPI00227DD271|nr:insulinase family protein [Alteromonas sp. a30]MCY7295862.1 hypothetical protein [Alteromonas sp. a30]